MRLLRTTILLSTFLLLTGEPLAAQQSLYQDALFLAEVKKRLTEDVSSEDGPLWEYHGSNYVEGANYPLYLILAKYSEFDRMDQKSYSANLADVRRRYQQNPFIRWERFFDPPGRTSSFTLTLKSSLHDILPVYQQKLHGNLTAEEEALSVAELDVGYRERIVTAQTQLEEANRSFNEQRKKAGLLNPNTVAVGLSDFIAERAQEELNLTFFSRFKESMNKDSELTLLFPATKNLLYKFEISNYKVFLAHARQAFNRDLDNLGVNLPKVLDLKKYQDLKNRPDVFNLALIYSIAELAYQEKPIEQIVLTAHRRLIDRQANLDRSINLAIANSLYDSLRTDNGVPYSTFALRDSVLHYVDNVANTLSETRAVTVALAEPSGDPLFARVGRENDRIGKTLYTMMKTMSDADQRKRDQLSDHRRKVTTREVQKIFFSSLFFDSRGQSFRGGTVSARYLDFNRHFIDANLRGLGYFGPEMLQVPSFYDKVLAEKPDDPVDIFARGLERTRELLSEAYEDNLLQHNRLITGVKDTLVKLQDSSVSTIALTEEIDYIAEQYGIAAELLRQRMHREFAAVRSATGGNPENDHYLAGLKYLVNRMDRLAGQELGFSGDAYRKNGVISYEEVSPADVMANSNQLLDEHEQLWRRQIEAVLAAYGNRRSLDSNVATDSTFQEPGGQPRAPAKKNTGGLTVRQVVERETNKTDPEYDFARSVFSNNNDEEPEEPGYEQIGGMLARNRQAIAAITAERKRIIHQLGRVEKELAPELYQARENARELAKAMEISAHILFAFRDFSQRYDTLFYLDTQRVEVSLQSVDAATGTVRTLAKDSLVIKRTPVPGTTDKLTSARWITLEEFEQLRKNPDAWKIFLGLLYQRLNSIEGAPRFGTSTVAKLATQFVNVANDMQLTENNLRLKKGTSPRSVTLKDYFPFIRSTVDLLNVVLNTNVLIDENAQRRRSGALGKITQISDEALSLYENIDVRDYGNAILNATELLRIITDQQFDQAQFEALAKVDRRRLLGSQRQVAAVFRYGTFMAEMINAQSSQQVKTILKSTTLPPGSSRIKREVTSNFTINAYLGAAAGRDRLLDAPADLDADALGAALSVPIGMTYSFSPGFLTNRSSFSLHVPLLDLGAITAYRSNPNGQTANVNALPELEWKNLFSPGAYLIYNFADSPFSVGVGGQYGPQLREINQANGEALFLNSWRFPMISATIDVPFYNLHTGARKIVVR